jgi:putative ABC transport system permease protein
VVLPADLYVRSANGGGAMNEQALFTPEAVQALARIAGVARTGTLRTRSLLLDPARPPVTLIARNLDAEAGRSLPLLGAALPVPAGRIGVYVSEAVADLYGAQAGAAFEPLSRAFAGAAPKEAPVFFVAGIWRDYARQFGAITIDARDFERLTGDRKVSDVALWLAPDADAARVMQAVRDIAAQALGAEDAVAIASVSQIRATSLRIFDRSFAVTYWLQAVAIGIGLFGIAASFSAQVLARRKEFGLLAHLGFTRAQVLAIVAGEGAAWTAIGAIAGLALGLTVSVVLVRVVNPQSFHWTMDLHAPWPRLFALCAAVLAAGTLTAWLAGRAAASHDAVLAVKEDW